MGKPKALKLSFKLGADKIIKQKKKPGLIPPKKVINPYGIKQFISPEERIPGMTFLRKGLHITSERSDYIEHQVIPLFLKMLANATDRSGNDYC